MAPPDLVSLVAGVEAQAGTRSGWLQDVDAARKLAPDVLAQSSACLPVTSEQIRE